MEEDDLKLILESHLKIMTALDFILDKEIWVSPEDFEKGHSIKSSLHFYRRNIRARLNA